MQLSIEIENESIVEKIIKLLEVFKDDGVKVKKIDKAIEEPREYDVDYEHSFQYKLDRADFIEMKEEL